MNLTKEYAQCIMHRIPNEIRIADSARATIVFSQCQTCVYVNVTLLHCMSRPKEFQIHRRSAQIEGCFAVCLPPPLTRQQ
jgi:hypothetical protein